MLSCIALLGLSLFTSLASSLTTNITRSNPRIFVLTDISNEPDDQESLVRLLLHADQYTVEGIVATTSYWLNDTTYPEHILDVIGAYGNVTSNLNAHSEAGFPSLSYLQSKVKTSHSVYGLTALDNATLSSGAELLITAIDNSADPLYIQLWGGATVLAEALNHVQQIRSSTALSIFTSRIRVYSISDQDDAGTWIRQQFPSIQYIASVNGFNMYGFAAWTGISGDAVYSLDQGGPNSSLVSTAYIKEHFQRGILGAKYPDPEYIMEGDTPSLLYTMQNGLNVPEHPEYGGWGGRYTLSDISGRSRHYADTADFVVGENGMTFVSNHATIWRWRSAYQNEMAARVQWSVSENYSAAVHPPRVIVNGSTGYVPLDIVVVPEQIITLDASASLDPDTNGTEALKFDWFHYREVTNAQSPDWSLRNIPQLNLTCLDDKCTGIKTVMPNVTLACPEDKGCQSYHVILSVTNSGETPITRYKRVIFDIQG